MYKVKIKNKVLKNVKKMPSARQDDFFDLIEDLQATGSIQKGWKNFSRLNDKKTEFHCHLEYRWVACWKVLPDKLLKFLTDNYGKVEIINNDDELVDITETAWYRERANSSTLGQVLKRYRKKNGMSQSELREKLGITKQNISAIERGPRGISKAIAHDLAGIFQVSPGIFI